MGLCSALSPRHQWLAFILDMRVAQTRKRHRRTRHHPAACRYFGLLDRWELFTERCELQVELAQRGVLKAEGQVQLRCRFCEAPIAAITSQPGRRGLPGLAMPRAQSKLRTAVSKSQPRVRSEPSRN